MESTSFSGQVRVAARIIDLLSSGLYPNPAACLKELINNAYDADATVVEVFVKPDAEQIIIKDDGEGFTREGFVQHFANVTESRKRDDGDTTKSGRDKIGKIGIGFIAANELCKEVEIFSTRKGSREVMQVTLNFAAMSKPINERKGQDGRVIKADYEGNVANASKLNEHYTILYLKNIKGEARKILNSALKSKRGQNDNKEGDALYGLKPETILSKLKNKNLKRWEEFDFYSHTMLQIALNVPVEYHKGWYPKRSDLKFLDSVEKIAKRNHFKVVYDGVELKKPVVLRDDRKIYAEEFAYNGDLVKAKGYFYSSHGTFYPKDMQGVLVRIKGSAVGTYRKDFLGFSQATEALIQNWVTGEIYVTHGLEDAMNIDRVTFRDTHPDYIEFRDALHESVGDFLIKSKAALYTKGARERKENRRKEGVKALKSVIKSDIHDISPRTARSIQKAWSQDDLSGKNLLKTYTPSQILEMTSDVAKRVLPKDLFEKFMQELNRKFFETGRK